MGLSPTLEEELSYLIKYIVSGWESGLYKALMIKEGMISDIFCLTFKGNAAKINNLPEGVKKRVVGSFFPGVIQLRSPDEQRVGRIRGLRKYKSIGDPCIFYFMGWACTEVWNDVTNVTTAYEAFMTDVNTQIGDTIVTRMP